MSRSVRSLQIGSIANLAIVAVVAYLIHYGSEYWWLTAVAIYMPRVLMLVPAAILLVLTAVWCRRFVVLNTVSTALVLGPVMGLAVPLEQWSGQNNVTHPLTVVSCNVQGCQPDFAAVLRDISAINPDVVAFQECRDEHPLMASYFDGWHVVHVDEYWIGSKYPVRHVGNCETSAFDRVSAVHVQVDTPAGAIDLFNVHQMTARRGLEYLDSRNTPQADSVARYKHHTYLRELEAGTTRAFVAAGASATPHLVVGDFNMPTTSSVYRAYWSDLTNTFDRAGLGYGYTSPCSSHRLWPPNTPWLRIDHILASPEWRVSECRIGDSAGSDHRLVAATLGL